MEIQELVIIYERIEEGCYSYELLNPISNISKFITEEQAMKIKEKYTIPFYELYQWVRKKQLEEIRKDMPF